MNRTFLILAGALIVGGAALFYVYRDTYIAEETGGPKIPVVVAARDIHFGEPIQLDWLTTRELPQSYVEERHVRASDMRALIGVPLAQSVREGEAVLSTDLSTLSDRQRTLSATIPPGRRAVSIRTTPAGSFGGLLRPGDRVDVLLSVQRHNVPGTGRAVIVAQNLLVLSIGHELRSIEPALGGDDPTAGHRRGWRTQVSLEVDPTQAQRVVLARRRGDLSLFLRNPSDVTVLEEPPAVAELQFYDPRSRTSWLRRFALVARPLPPALEEAPAPGVDAGQPPPAPPGGG